MTFEEYVDEVTKQLWIWRAANGIVRGSSSENDPKVIGALKRRTNAAIALDNAAVARTDSIKKSILGERNL